MRTRHRFGRSRRTRLKLHERVSIPAAVDYMKRRWPRVIGRAPKYATFKERILGYHAFWGASDRFIRHAYSKFVREQGWK